MAWVLLALVLQGKRILPERTRSEQQGPSASSRPHRDRVFFFWQTRGHSAQTETTVGTPARTSRRHRRVVLDTFGDAPDMSRWLAATVLGASLFVYVVQAEGVRGAHDEAPHQDDAPWPSGGCGRPAVFPPIPVGVPNAMTVKVNDPNLFNQYRDYVLYLPPGYDKSTPLPVVSDRRGGPHTVSGVLEGADAPTEPSCAPCPPYTLPTPAPAPAPTLPHLQAHTPQSRPLDRGYSDGCHAMPHSHRRRPSSQVFYFPSFYITASAAFFMNKLFWMSGQQDGNFAVVVLNGMNDCNEMNCEPQGDMSTQRDAGWAKAPF